MTEKCPNCGFTVELSPRERRSLLAEVSKFKEENEQVRNDLMLSLDPIYCKICGSCGEDGCCKPEMCRNPGHKHCLHGSVSTRHADE